MKTTMITILLALSACTTVVYQYPDGGPPGPDSSFMDGGTNDRDTAATEDSGPLRFDTGVIDAREIETAVCVDVLTNDEYGDVLCLDFYRKLNRVHDCADRGIGTNYDDIGYLEQQDIPCPWIDFAGCNRCDGWSASQCIGWLGSVVSVATCDEAIDHFNTPECGYPLCGFYE